MHYRPDTARRCHGRTAIRALLAGLALGACERSPQEPPDLTGPYPAAASVTGGVLSVPVTGTSDAGGTFHGTLTVAGAGFALDAGPYLVVQLKGVVVRAAPPGSEVPTERVDLVARDIEMNYADDVKGEEDCIRLELTVPPQFDPGTKTTLNVDVAELSLPLAGPASLIADLICATDEAIERGWQPQPPPQ